jgi:glutathione synthase/RimK-type ligase-like ATP-grasp enzyme
MTERPPPSARYSNGPTSNRAPAMPGPSKRVGLLVGRERSFPDALIAEVARRSANVKVEYVQFGAPRAKEKPPYDVVVDRISHEVTCYQPFLKLCSLYGVYVINNPFWRISDDKFFNAGLADQLGLSVPKTILLPSKSYGEDTNAESLTRNMQFVDWAGIERDLGFPMYMKPHWGGGWRNVSRVANLTELHAAYDKSGGLTMILQEEIRWTQYVRCLVIGRRDVLPALWDPRHSHFERYTRATETMAPLSSELEERVVADALTITRALGYDMNTVEFAIQDGVPYAIDYMNSAPDFDISSLGEAHFAWVVRKMAKLVVDVAQAEREEPELSATYFLTGAR